MMTALLESPIFSILPQNLKVLIKQALISQAIRQSIVMTVGSVTASLFMAAAMIFASRYFGPEKFGAFSVSTALMAVLAKFLDFGLNQLLPRFFNQWHQNEARQKDLLRFISVSKLVLVLLVTTLGVILTPMIVQFLRFDYPYLIYWSFFGAAAIALYEYIYLLLSAEHKFGSVSALNISQGMIKAGLFGILFLTGLGSLGTITAVYYIIPFLVVLFFIPQLKLSIFQLPKPIDPVVVAGIKRHLPHAALSVIAATLITNLDLLLVQRYLSHFDAGIYAGAAKIAMFIGFVTASVGGVLNNRVSRYKDKLTLYTYLRKSLVMVIVASLGIVTFIPLARLAVVVTIGPDYLSGTGAVMLLVTNAFINLAIVPFISFFYAVEHPRFFSMGGLLQVAIIFLGNYFFIQQFGITATALTRIVATCSFGLFTIWYVRYAVGKLP